MNGRSEPVASSHALRSYLQAVVGAGALVFAWSVFGAYQTPKPGEWLLLAAVAVLTGSFRLTFASVAANVAIDDTFFITTAVLFGPAPATVAIAVGAVVLSVRRRKPVRQIAFNSASLALSMWAGAQTFFLIARTPPLAVGHTPITPLVLPLVALAVVYFAMNSGLMAVVIGLDLRQSPVEIWKSHFRWLVVGYLGAASVAFCLVLLIQQASLTSALMVLPLLLVFHLTLRSSFGRLDDAKRHLGDLDRLYLSTIETLAMAIDAKDDVTHSHVRRVQAYSVGLAHALGINDELEIKALKAAALLHDTGKLAVPEHILNKPGKLTESEFEKMKLHVDVGADILSLVDFPYPVVPIVRAHHESWNGSGYPRGLKGEEIPIGARILSVVDCFDALTSDRPYRRALTDEAAFEILRERRGTMYDPKVVDTFIAVHHDIVVEKEDPPAHREVLSRIADSRADANAKPEIPAAPTASPASHEVLAFVSLARIASGDGSVADVLALSSNLIRDIAPGVSGAWFLPDGKRDQLIAADAFGPAASILRGTTIGIGQRLTGWVASSRQVIVNSDAALDLESKAVAVTPALTTCLSAPLLMGNTFVGVLTLYASTSDAFDADRSRVIEMIAPHVAGAVHAASRNAAALKEPPSADRAAAAGRDLRLVSTR